MKLLLTIAAVFRPGLGFTHSSDGPNVLFILADDMGWGDLAINGGASVPVPHKDGLAREGTRFTQFYTASPICEGREEREMRN